MQESPFLCKRAIPSFGNEKIKWGENSDQPGQPIEKMEVVNRERRSFTFYEGSGPQGYSKTSLFGDDVASLAETMPDLNELRIAVPIPSKPIQPICPKEGKIGFIGLPLYRKQRFFSYTAEPSEMCSIVDTSSRLFSPKENIEETSPIIDFGKLANIPGLSHFSLLGKVEKVPSCKLLNDLIERFLLNDRIDPSEISQLTKGEFLILDCLMKRKLKIGTDEYVQDSSSVDYGVLKVKRLEENYKMVFKSALKHIGNIFKKKRKGKKSKSEDSNFYEHYFAEVSKRRGIPIEAFFHPNKKLKGSGKKSVPNQKTMNSRYLENLLSSGVFRDDLTNYLEDQFISNYNERRRKKIDNLVDKLRKKFLETSNSFHLLKDYLEKNSKCKLPWSNYELELAKQCVILLIQEKEQEDIRMGP